MNVVGVVNVSVFNLVDDIYNICEFCIVCVVNLVVGVIKFCRFDFGVVVMGRDAVVFMRIEFFLVVLLGFMM